MKRLSAALAAYLVSACGSGDVYGDWHIRFVGTCDGLMTVIGTADSLRGSWSCSNASGSLAGASNNGHLSLQLSSPILQHALQVDAVVDGSSMSGTVAAADYPQHPFQASR